jgi:hypothetical protein
MPRGLVALLFSVALSVGCGHNIGDSCTTNVDCDPTGIRFCDTASPGGYCTIDGCDVDTCPSGSVCVRFFTQIANAPCTFTPIGAPRNNDCPIDQICVCDNSVDGNCIDNTGHCAPLSSEHRWCQHACTSDGDCRVGYACRTSGTLGGEPVPSFDMGSIVVQPVKFCSVPPPAP